MTYLVTQIAKWLIRVFVLGFTLFFAYATFVVWRDNVLSGKVVATGLLVMGILLTVAVFRPHDTFLTSGLHRGRRIRRGEIRSIEHKPDGYHIVYDKDHKRVIADSVLILEDESGNEVVVPRVTGEDFIDRLLMGEEAAFAKARRLLWQGIAAFLTVSVVGFTIAITGLRVYHIPEMRVVGLLCVLPSVNILFLLLMFQWILSWQLRRKR